MSDDQKKGSHAPFTAPASIAPPQVSTNKYKGPKKLNSSRKQLKYAKKKQKQKRSISVRGLISGFFILIITSVAVIAVTSPDILSKIAAGEIIERTETCTVTEINASLYFDTTCGKFLWDTERQPGSPSVSLVEGQTYKIQSSGMRIGVAKTFPAVISYEKAAA